MTVSAPLSKHWQTLTPKPRFITEWPDPSNGVGAKIIKTMELLGDKPMPWQELLAHVVGQRNADGTPRYRFIVVTVPRQAGKTTLCNAIQFHRAVSSPRSKVWYTADNGQKARTKWLELVDAVDRSVFKPPFAKFRKTNGAEAILLPSLRSQIRPHPPTRDSLHSEQSDLNIIDEAWSFDEVEASALMQAITPTQSTRRNRQTIVISTMGDAQSTWFHGLVDKGYRREDVFLLDYGIPFDADPTDVELVASYHPAYGFTQDMDAIRDGLAQLGPAGFARGYANLRTGARETLIPQPKWDAAQTLDAMPADVPAFIGAAISHDRTETAIAAAAMVDGLPFVEILEVRPGTAWGSARLAELAGTPHVSGIVIDQVSPAATMFAEAERLGLKPAPISARELATACAEIYDRLLSDQPKIVFKTHAALDTAMAVVERRRMGDAWIWDRKKSAGSLAALDAATAAIHGLLTHRPATKPFIR